MTERLEPYIVTEYDSKTGKTETYVVDPRSAKQETSENDRKIFELCKLSIRYEFSNEGDKASESITSACQYAQAIQSKSAYTLLVQRLIALKQFDQLPGLVQLGQKLNDDSTLTVVAPILAKLGQVNQAVSLVKSLNLEGHSEDTKIIALAKVASEMANQNYSSRAYQLIEQSLQMAQDVKRSKNKVLAEIARQAAYAGFYEKACEIAQAVVPEIRRTATLAEIETIRSRF